MANKNEINAVVDRVVIRVLTIAGLGFVALTLAGQLVRMSQPDPTAVEIQRQADRIGASLDRLENKSAVPSTVDPAAARSEYCQWLLSESSNSETVSDFLEKKRLEAQSNGKTYPESVEKTICG